MKKALLELFRKNSTYIPPRKSNVIEVHFGPKLPQYLYPLSPQEDIASELGKIENTFEIRKVEGFLRSISLENFDLIRDWCLGSQEDKVVFLKDKQLKPYGVFSDEYRGYSKEEEDIRYFNKIMNAYGVDAVMNGWYCWHREELIDYFKENHDVRFTR